MGELREFFELTLLAEVLERVMEALDMIEIDVKEAESKMVELVIEVTESLEKGKMIFKEADKIFTSLLALKTVKTKR